MTLVSTVTVGAGGAASIDFTSIPQTGTDLLIVGSIRDAAGATSWDAVLTLNGSSTGITVRRLYGNGSTAASDNNTVARVKIDGASATANTFGNFSIYIPNYAGATNKSYSIDTVTENNATAAQQYLIAGLWANTAAVTNLQLTSDGGSSFLQYSTASLYTIQKGSGGASVA